MPKLKQSYTQINDASFAALIEEAKSLAPDSDEFSMLCSREAFQQVVCLTDFRPGPGEDEGLIGWRISVMTRADLGPGMFELHAIGSDCVIAAQVI